MSSETTQAFQKYALAFEAGYASRDWKATVGPCLTDDHVWLVEGAGPPAGGLTQGRDAVLEAIRRSCDFFDRRFDVRAPQIVDGPTPIPGGIHMTWVVTYRRDGLPDFVLRGEEWDFFADGKLEMHREKLHNVPEAMAFLARHAKELLPVS
jgi:hypothetical protein